MRDALPWAAGPEPFEHRTFLNLDLLDTEFIDIDRRVRMLALHVCHRRFQQLRHIVGRAFVMLSSSRLSASLTILPATASTTSRAFRGVLSQISYLCR